jgi:hypothetical protein
MTDLQIINEAIIRFDRILIGLFTKRNGFISEKEKKREINGLIDFCKNSLQNISDKKYTQKLNEIINFNFDSEQALVEKMFMELKSLSPNPLIEYWNLKKAECNESRNSYEEFLVSYKVHNK